MGPDAEPDNRPDRTAPETEPTLEHVETFTDGVYAIAATLLALEVAVPRLRDPSAHQLTSTLLDEWPVMAAFVLSFVLVSSVWINHRRMLSYFRRADHGLIWFNVALLMDVVLIPPFTLLLGRYLRDPGAQVVAGVAYGGLWTVGGLLFNAMWWYGSRHPALVDPRIDSRHLRELTTRWIASPITYGVSTALTLLSVWLGLAGFALIALLFIFPPPTPGGQEQE